MFYFPESPSDASMDCEPKRITKALVNIPRQSVDGSYISIDTNLLLCPQDRTRQGSNYVHPGHYSRQSIGLLGNSTFSKMAVKMG